MEKSEILHMWRVCDVENIVIDAKFMQFMPQFMYFHVEPYSMFVEKKWQISGLHFNYILIAFWLDYGYFLATLWLHSDYILPTF